MKKAMTPLISTILLLAFAIGLGTLVMSWGNMERSSPHSCDAVQLSITELSSKKQLCLNGNMLQMTLQNDGNAEIKSVQVVILTQDSVMNYGIPSGIMPGQYKFLEAPIADTTKILKIRLIPTLANIECVNKRVEIEGLGMCNEN